MAELIAQDLWQQALSDAKPDGRPETVTIADLVALFTAHCRSYHRGDHVQYALRALSEAHPTLPVNDFGPTKLKAVQAAMVTSGLRRGVINQRVQVIKQAFKWAVSEEMVHYGVSHALSAVAGLREGQRVGGGAVATESQGVRDVGEDHLVKTLPCLPAAVRAMVELQGLTGMRPGEICDMRPCEIDTAGEVWVYRPAQHKTAHRGKERWVLLGPAAQKALSPLLPHDVSARIFSYRVDSYRRAVIRACVQAFPAPEGLDDGARGEWNREHRWSPNQLRHSFATRVRREHGLEAAQILLGHTQAYVTQIYAQRDLAKAVAIMTKHG